MNLSYSLPKRSNRLDARLLAVLVMLAFLALAILPVRMISQQMGQDLAPVQAVSMAAFHAVPVPTPSQSHWQHVLPQRSATPSPVVFQPAAQPVATPPAGK